jgi:tetratricopeptide (TPR) repeat protein
MSWLAPSWLLVGLAAVVLLSATALLGRWRALQQTRVATTLLWHRWLGGFPATGATRLALWLAAAALAAVAAAGPRWGAPGTTTAPGLDLAIALDVSDSMRCADVHPDRLGRAATVLRYALERQGLGNIALVVGGATAQPLVPLTPDRGTVEARLFDPELSRWVTPGSNLAVLLATAGAQLTSSASARAILLATDGEELEGDAAAMAATLRGSGIAIVTLLTGTPGGAPVPRREADGRSAYARGPDGELVRSHAHPELLARISGPASNRVDAASPAAPQQLGEILARVAKASQHEEAPVRSAPLVLAAALVATASFLLWPWRRSVLATVLLPLPMLAAAPAPKPSPSLWQRLLPASGAVMAQRASAAAAHGAWDAAGRDYGLAAALDPDNGELRLAWAAARAFAGDGTGEDVLAAWTGEPKLAEMALYDLGTSRLVRGDTAGALTALRQALALDPTDTAAWHNLQLVLVQVRQAHGSQAPLDPLASVRRDRLVKAAAQAALQPLLLVAPAPATPNRGRDW